MSVTRVFHKLQLVPNSPERLEFDLIVIGEAYEKDLSFMVELVLERARITKQIIWLMLQEDQKNALVGLISKRPRPKYIVDHDEITEKDLHFNDIVLAAIEKKEPS